MTGADVMIRLFSPVLIFLFVTNTSLYAQDEFEPRKPKQTVGWIEKVKIYPGDLLLNARLTPGLGTSSMHAENIKKMRKNKKIWVTFEVTDQYGNTSRLSREAIRSAKVKTPEGKNFEEHVVTLGMCLGRTYFEDEVKLVAKKHEQYAIRLGRQALEGNFLIDPAAKMITEPECGERGKDLGPVETVESAEGGEEGSSQGGGAE